jgi:hypothetical protein
MRTRNAPSTTLRHSDERMVRASAVTAGMPSLTNSAGALMAQTASTRPTGLCPVARRAAVAPIDAPMTTT